MQQNPPANLLDPNLSLILGCLYKLIHIHSYAVRNTAPGQQAVASLRTPNEWIWISLMGLENGMTDLVQLYLCEMHGKPEEAVVGARAVSLQRFSLGVFEFIADHSFAFVHCQVVLGNATAPGSRCTKKCSSSDQRKRTVTDDEHRPYHSLTRLARQKSATALILVYILASVC